MNNRFFTRQAAEADRQLQKPWTGRRPGRRARPGMRHVWNTARVWPALALILVAGCGKKAGHALPNPPRVAQCEPGKAGGRVVLATEGIPKTFNPLLANDSGSESVTRLLFCGLIRLDMITQEPEPELAESWSVATDQKTWTFKLRRGLHWSDGQPLTADDVVFTWNELIYNPEYSRYLRDLLRVDGKNFTVSKVDELTLRVVTPEVIAPFLQLVSTAPVLPKHRLGREVRAKNFLNTYAVRADPKTIVGSGPFRLKDSRAGKEVLLERNPEYHAVDKKGVRLPYFDEVQLNVTSDARMAATFFFQSLSDVCETVRPDARTQFETALVKRGGRLVELEASGECNYFWFNQNTNADTAGKPLVNPVRLNWFRDKKFRQAVSCALDRAQMVREVYAGHGRPVLSFVGADNVKWNNPSVARFDYDPARARALLAEIGIQDRNGDGLLEDAAGHLIELSILSNADNVPRSRLAVMIQNDLNKIGFKAEYQPVTYQTILAKMTTTFDYEGAIVGLGGGGVDPTSQINILKSGEPLHQWFPGQKSPATEWEARIDLLMDAQLQTLDFSARKKYYAEVQAIWAEQQPMIPVAAPLISVALRPDLANVRPAAGSAYHATWNVEELYLGAK